MSLRRIIIETGMGADLHGGDPTKAAKRAVEDALRHSSLSLFGALKLNPKTMRVTIRLGVPNPGAVDRGAVAALAPYGTVEVIAEEGGVSAAGLGAPDGSDAILCAAAITVEVDIPDGKWRLAGP